MCGIVGIWSKERCDSKYLSHLIDRMLNVLIHRGPDDGGYCFGPNIAMGNRRLKIFDLSDAGNQPFFNDDGKIWLVLNGEIYNHYELRQELENDFSFRSTSDTEVLLRSYEKWGMKCLDRLIGMFAFAIWDARDQNLILCRDRLGIKPLYYHFDGNTLLFASEIKALLAAGVETVPNLNVIRDYLTSGYYDHTEQTFFKGVSQVKQGRFLTINANNVTETCYWDLAERIGEENQEPKDAEEAYWEVLQDAIRLRMRADVPYAVMLSGGLDSSVLADLADQYVGSNPLNVCTFRHKESLYDEGPWADLVSRGRNWISHNVTITENDVEHLLPLALWHQDEPFGSVATFADILLASMARENGIYVLLEGQGADETLGGYEYYYTYYLADLALRDESKARKLHRDYALKRGVDPSALEASFQEIIAKGVYVNGRIGQDGTTATKDSVLSPELLRSNGTGFEEANLFALRFENVLYRDLFYTKVPRVLRFKDKAYMMHGVELRVPFLDHRLVELSFSISPESKLDDGFTKSYLRHRIAGSLPDEICFHVKRQVQTPQREWLRGALRPLVEEVINSDSFKQRGLFVPKKVHDIYRKYIDYPEAYPNSFFIWQWLLIEWWFRIFIDRAYVPSTYEWPNSSNVRRYPPLSTK